MSSSSNSSSHSSSEETNYDWEQLASFTSTSMNQDEVQMDSKLEDFKPWVLHPLFSLDEIFHDSSDDLRSAFRDPAVYLQFPQGLVRDALTSIKTEESWPFDIQSSSHFQPTLASMEPLQSSFCPSVFSISAAAAVAQMSANSPSSTFSISPEALSSSSPSERHSPASNNLPFVKIEDIFNGSSHQAEDEEASSPGAGSSCELGQLTTEYMTDKKAGMSVSRSDRPLVIFWDPSSRRPVISTSSDISTRFSHYQMVRFEPGTHYDVTPLMTSADDVEMNGQQPKPWSGKGPGNFWLKAQVLPRKRCICGFSFLGGREAEDFFKRPSVIREHIVGCKEWDSEDPLKKLCMLHRQADKTKQRTGRRNQASQTSPKNLRRLMTTKIP